MSDDVFYTVIDLDNPEESVENYDRLEQARECAKKYLEEGNGTIVHISKAIIRMENQISETYLSDPGDREADK